MLLQCMCVCACMPREGMLREERMCKCTVPYRSADALASTSAAKLNSYKENRPENVVPLPCITLSMFDCTILHTCTWLYMIDT